MNSRRAVAVCLAGAMVLLGVQSGAERPAEKPAAAQAAAEKEKH